MHTDIIKMVESGCPNSKLDIFADNFNKIKLFNMEDVENHRLSRVDSQTYPDTTKNLDCIAEKLRFLNNQNNKSSPSKMGLSKLDRCSEENLNEKCLSNSMKTTPENLVVEVTPNNVKIRPSKKPGFLSNIMRRLSKSTPKIFSKSKKQKKSETDVQGDSEKGCQKNEDIPCPNKSKNDTDENTSTKLTPSKTVGKIFQKLTRKRKGKAKITSEPHSTIDSRPSLSSVANHCLHYDSTNFPKDIYINKLCRKELPLYNYSADCILDYDRYGKRPKEEVSNTSEETREEHGSKCSPGMKSNSRDTFSNEFPILEAPSTQLSEKMFNSLKLTLALYGYGNYGLNSSRLASKSCIDFHVTKSQKRAKSREKNSSNQEVLDHNSNKCDNNNNDEFDNVRQPTDDGSDDEMMKEKCEDENVTEVNKNGNKQDIDNEQIVLKKSQRPNDIKFQRSREHSQSLVARSSMIMLRVSHNSPRSKVSSNQLTSPNKEVNNVVNGSADHCHKTSPSNFNFDNLSISSNKEIDCVGNKEDENNLEYSSLGNTDISSGYRVKDSAIVEQRKMDDEDLFDGHYFLEIVRQHENEILNKIDIVQKYIDNTELELDDEVSGQLMVTVGKAKLLLSEKVQQFKGLCEKNISGIQHDNELPTLSSDLRGFWDMVFGQIEDVNRNFVTVERIRINDWKMIPFHETIMIQSSATNRNSNGGGSGTCSTPIRNRKSISSQLKTRINKANKISSDRSESDIYLGSTVPGDPLTSLTASTNGTGAFDIDSSVQHAKLLSADKRKKMMLFKMNQRAALMAQKTSDSKDDDIKFY